MTFLLSNILPSDHKSDLTLPKCQLVYNIITQISVHLAQLISDAIHQFVGIAPPRHPVEPKKSNRALGFPALITGLCQFYGVPITSKSSFGLPLTGNSLRNIACQGRYSNRGKTSRSSRPQTHHHRLHISYHP